MKILEVQHAEKYYGNKGNVTAALNDLSFSVEEGEFVGIMGASGSGKTTLLNCISTIDKLSAGKALIGGQDIMSLKGAALDEFRSKKLGFIFQDFNLLDTMTARENISLALSLCGTAPGEIDERISLIAETLGKLNSERNATILMVTHDSFSASYAGRIIFIKDGKIFSEIIRDEDEDRRSFFRRIVDVTSVLGGELDEVV